MSHETKAATFQLCAECGQPYTPTPTNKSGFCSWDCFDVKPRPNAAEALHGFLGPDITMTRVDGQTTPTAGCRCHLPDADPYACEADDCTYDFPELSPFGGGPVHGADAKVSRRCGTCGWLTSVWHVDDGSAEAELHDHTVRAHGATTMTKENS